MLKEMIPFSWKKELEDEFLKEYFLKLESFSQEIYENNNNNNIYPESKNIFRALELTPYEEVKVVILGQDPYYRSHQADGLAFSVKKGVKIPPSLRNIFTEMEDDLGYEPPEHGSLDAWAKQGVFLLNTSLTVEDGKPNSHIKAGWINLTDAIIKSLSKKENIVYILWGGNAQKKKKLVNARDNLIIESSHPSPLSSYRGFFGSKPFSRTNKYLVSKGKEEIDWKLD